MDLSPIVCQGREERGVFQGVEALLGGSMVISPPFLPLQPPLSVRWSSPVSKKHTKTDQVTPSPNFDEDSILAAPSLSIHLSYY